MGSSITPTVGSNNTNSGKGGSPISESSGKTGGLVSSIQNQMSSVILPNTQTKTPEPYKDTVGNLPNGTGLNGTVTLPGNGGQPAFGQPNANGNTGMTPIGTGLNNKNSFSENAFSSNTGDNRPSPMGKGIGGSQGSGKTASNLIK